MWKIVNDFQSDLINTTRPLHRRELFICSSHQERGARTCRRYRQHSDKACYGKRNNNTSTKKSHIHIIQLHLLWCLEWDLKISSRRLKLKTTKNSCLLGVLDWTLCFDGIEENEIIAKRIVRTMLSCYMRFWRLAVWHLSPYFFLFQLAQTMRSAILVFPRSAYAWTFSTDSIRIKIMNCVLSSHTMWNPWFSIIFSSSFSFHQWAQSIFNDI